MDSRSNGPLGGRNPAKKLLRQILPVVTENLGLRPSAMPAVCTGERLDPDRWQAAPMAAYWVGQATILVRLHGVTILTDPHFHDTAGPRIAGRSTGRRRSTAPPLTIDELPPVDIIALSHAHMDHWEKGSLERLARKETAVIIPHRTRALLPRGKARFGEVFEATWGEQHEIRGLRFTALQPKHWGARWGFDWWRGYNAYAIDTTKRRVLFAGDTGETRAFDEIGPVDLAIIGIGNSYEPWGRHHTSPEQAAAMAERMRARLLAPVHHATFHDPTESRDEPLERLRRVWPDDRIVCPRVGEAFYADGQCGA